MAVAEEPRARRGPRVLRGLRDLPLFWKLLLPFLALILFLGVIGTVLVVRDLSSRARVLLDEDLLRRSLAARSAVHDRELYLIEAVNFAANMNGMAGAVQARDAAAVADLLRSALALKGDLDLLVATDSRGRGLVELVPGRAGSVLHPGRGGRWSAHGFVSRALGDRTGGKWSGLLDVGGRTMVAVSSPVCSEARGCSPVGAALAGMDMTRLAGEALGASAPRQARGSSGVALYGLDGSTLAVAGRAVPGAVPDVPGGRLVRRVRQAGAEEVAILYAPLEMQGKPAAVLAVNVPTAPAFSSAQGARLRLVPLLVAALLGIVGIGAALSRFILAQVRPLVATNRALGSGLLSARAPVLSRDELGQLARGLNVMAEQLQASVETLEMRVDQRTEEIQRLMRERSEFFASMSHEFRTPLAAILAYAKMLRDPAYRKTGAWASDAGKTLQDSAEQLLGLVNDILNLAKAEAGHVDTTLEEVRLSEFVKSMRRTIEGLARGGGLRLRIEVPSDLPPVSADPTRLREIILNLVDNAVKYTPPGGRVALAAAARNGLVAVSVADSGVGIPADARDRIFEPFFRVEGTTAQQGQPSTGLGLALAKRLVEAQGGEIAFTSEPGAGTTFTFTLTPAARPRRDA